MLYDDVRGVAEPLNETSGLFPEGLIVRGRLLLDLDLPKTAADKHRPLGQEMVLQPLLSFTEGGPDKSKLTVSVGRGTIYTVFTYTVYIDIVYMGHVL